MALTGTGTKADPLIVHTIEELYAACRYVNPDVSFDDSNRVGYIEIANDLDFNDAPDFKECPNKFITPDIRLGDTDNNKVSIDFKGHTLSNLYSFDIEGSAIGVRSNHGIRLKNAIIEAVLIDFTRYTSIAIGVGDYSTYPIFDNCDFRIKHYIYNTYSYMSSIFKMVKMVNCVVNIDIFYTSNSYIGDGVQFFPFRDIPGAGSTVSYPDKIYKAWLYNEFNIRFVYIGTSNWNGSTIPIFQGASDAITFSSIFVTSIANAANPANIEMLSNREKTFTNCFFVMRNMNQSHKSTFYHNTGGGCSVGGVNFYDNEVCDTVNFNSVDGGTMLSLTSAQCKNAAYLEDKGFVIAYDGTS